MKQSWKKAGLAIVLAVAGSATAMAQSDPRVYFGTVGFVDDSTVQVGGKRGIMVKGSSVMSDGREVSLSSVRTGMPATLELDASDRIIELRVTGVVE